MDDEAHRPTAGRAESNRAAALRGLYDALWDWNLQTGEVYYSPAWTRMLGYGEGELAAHIDTWGRLCHPDDRGRVLGLVEEYLASGRDRFEVEFRLRHADGHWLQILSRGTLVRNADGRPAEPHHLIGTHIDISGHAATERRLELSLSLLRATLEATADGLLLADGQGHIETFNQRFADLWRLPPEILESGDDDAALEFVLGQLLDPQAFVDRVRELYANPGQESFDVLHFKDGRVFERYSRPQRLGDAVTGRLWSFRDISDRERAIAALADQVRRSRTLFEQSRDGIVVIDMAGRAVECNARFAEMIGRTVEEVTTLQVWDWDVSMEPERIRQVFLSQHLPPHQFQTRHRRKDGSIVDVEIATGNLTWEGQPAYLCTVRDISARLQAEAERQLLQEQLLQAQKMDAIGQLTGGIAHEFNNMLGVVLGYASLAGGVAAESGDATMAEYLSAIRRAGENARDLVAKLLAFGRRRPVAQRTPQDPAALTRTALQLLRPALPTSLSIETDLPAGLPAVIVDAMEFQQVITNLMLNAAQAAGQQGSVTLRLRPWRDEAKCAGCRLLFAGPYVALSVTDNGGGVSREALDRIFEPFFTTKEVGRGTGLGLPVVHGIVHAIGGHLLVDPGEGSGATFTLLLPPGGDPADLAVPAPASTNGTAGAPLRALIVDDQPEVAAMLGRMLSVRGHQVTVLDDALGALAAFRAEPLAFDLVISDQTMPGMSGRDLLLAIRQVRAEVPLVLWTGYSEVADEAAAAALGFAGFLRKPATMEDLDALLAQLPGEDRPRRDQSIPG